MARPPTVNVFKKPIIVFIGFQFYRGSMQTTFFCFTNKSEKDKKKKNEQNTQRRGDKVGREFSMKKIN